jgi:hypothetical protein
VSAIRAAHRTFRAHMADPEAPNAANPIHSGGGARAYGFRAALVGGVTVYGWTVATILDALGDAWLEDGFAELEFRRPVHPDESLEVRVDDDGTLTVAATADDVRLRGRIGRGDPAWLATLARSGRTVPESVETRPRLTADNVPRGQDLPALGVTLDRAQAEQFCREKQGETLACFYGDHAFVHPAWLATQPIHLLHHAYVYGPAVHTASLVAQRRPARVGEAFVITGRCVDAFERKGHAYIVNDCAILDGAAQVVTQIRHTAIYRLAAPAGATA